MSTHKHIDLICVAVLVCTLLLTVLFINGERFGLEAITDRDAEGSSDSIFFTLNDRDGAWSAAGATRITLAGDHAAVAGGGAYTYDGNVVIAQAGRYILSGTLSDGSVIVSADSGAKVWLMLNGVEINCSDDACLRVEQADKVFLTLAADTENSMSSGAEYAEAALADNTGGVIFSRDDLTLNGSGSLRVAGAYRHGIDVNDELVITGGSISVEAPRDGIHANDGLRIENAELTLKTGDEGLCLQGGEALLYIASGSFEIESGAASVKSAGGILIEGGSFTINSSADGIHGMGSVAITDGSLTISAADDGIHADQTVSISGGSVNIPACYEGIEALTIDILGGEIEIYPSDDGMNANGGSGFGFGPPGMPGRNTDADEGEKDEETWIHIGGGSITIVNQTARDADGLDSNGDILISGGSIRVSLPGGGSNNAIDYGSESGGVCEIRGGDLVACGAGAMAENFSDSSTQCSIFFSPGYTAAADTELSLRNADGETLLRYTPPCGYSVVSLSSPEMRLGETYTVVIGDREREITLDAVNTAVGISGGSVPGQWSHGMDVDDEEHPGRPGRGMRQESPDFSDMPSPPEPGGMPRPEDDGSRNPGAEQSGTADTDTPQAETVGPDSAATGPQPVDSAVWRMLGACFLVLAAGIVFAGKYRK